MRKLRIAVLVVLVALMAACKTTKLVESDTKTEISEETIETKRNLGVTVPGWDLGLSDNIGSRLVFVPVPGKPGEEEPCIVIKPGTKIISGKDSINFLSFQIDSLGNYIAKASQREHELQVEITEKTKIITKQTETINRYIEKESAFKKFIDNVVICIALAVVILGLLIYFLRKL